MVSRLASPTGRRSRGGGLAISKACMNDGKQGITPDASLAGGDCRKQQEKTRMEMQRDNKHC